MKNRRVLLTRHRQASERSRETLLKRGYKAVIMPLSKIDPFFSPFPADRFDAIAFTSPLAPTMLSQSPYFEFLVSLPVFCVGDFTAHCAIRAGFHRVEGVAKNAKSLLPFMTKFAEGKKFLYPRARDHSLNFSRYLSEVDGVCVDWEIYSNNLLWPDAEEVKVSLQSTDAIFLFSQRTARHFFDVIKKYLVADSETHILSHLTFVCMSLRISAAIPKAFQKQVFVSDDSNESSMIDCLKLPDVKPNGRDAI